MVKKMNLAKRKNKLGDLTFKFKYANFPKKLTFLLTFQES